MCPKFSVVHCSCLNPWQQHPCYQPFHINLTFININFLLSKCHVCRFEYLTKKYEMQWKWQIVSIHMSISILKMFYQYKRKWLYKNWLTETRFCCCNLSTAEHSINRLVKSNYFGAIVFYFLTKCSHSKLVTRHVFPVSAKLDYAAFCTDGYLQFQRHPSQTTHLTVLFIKMYDYLGCPALEWLSLLIQIVNIKLMWKRMCQ